MPRAIAFIGASLSASAPAFGNSLRADPQLRNGELSWFLLTETKDQVTRALGPPKAVAGFGQDFLSWQYQIGNVDHEEFSHQVVFRESTRGIVSITRNYDPNEMSMRCFRRRKRQCTIIRRVKSLNSACACAVCRRTRPDGHGTSKPGQVTGQLVLMRESELRFFYPWVSQQLARRHHEL